MRLCATGCCWHWQGVAAACLQLPGAAVDACAACGLAPSTHHPQPKGSSFTGEDKEFLRVTLGQGQVIPAFEEALASMKVRAVAPLCTMCTAHASAATHCATMRPAGSCRLGPAGNLTPCCWRCASHRVACRWAASAASWCLWSWGTPTTTTRSRALGQPHSRCAASRLLCCARYGGAARQSMQRQGHQRVRPTL